MARLETPPGLAREVKFAYWKDRHRTTLSATTTAYTTGNPVANEEALPADFAERVVNARYNPVMRRDFERWAAAAQANRRSTAAPITFDAVAAFTQKPVAAQTAPEPVAEAEPVVEEEAQPEEVAEDITAADVEAGDVEADDDDE